MYLCIYTHLFLCVPPPPTAVLLWQCWTRCDIYIYIYIYIYVYICIYIYIQPIADRVAQHLEIISKNFQFSTRRTRILMGFIIHYLILIVNPMGRILVRWKSFRNTLEMLCHPICNLLYICIYIYDA